MCWSTDHVVSSSEDIRVEGVLFGTFQVQNLPCNR